MVAVALHDPEVLVLFRRGAKAVAHVIHTEPEGALVGDVLVVGRQDATRQAAQVARLPRFGGPAIAVPRHEVRQLQRFPCGPRPTQRMKGEVHDECPVLKQHMTADAATRRDAHPNPDGGHERLAQRIAQHKRRHHIHIAVARQIHVVPHTVPASRSNSATSCPDRAHSSRVRPCTVTTLNCCQIPSR